MKPEYSEVIIIIIITIIIIIIIIIIYPCTHIMISYDYDILSYFVT